MSCPVCALTSAATIPGVVNGTLECVAPSVFRTAMFSAIYLVMSEPAVFKEELCGPCKEDLISVAAVAQRTKLFGGTAIG